MTKRAIFFTTDRTGVQPSWGGPFIEGLRRHGWQAEVSNSVERCDLFVLWGARRTALMDKARARGAEICVLERAYLGDRFQWLSVSFGGGLNGRATFRGPFEDGTRWDRHFAHLMQPWQARPEGYALIMEQVPGDTAVTNVDLPHFYQRARLALQDHMPVKQRPHPNVSPRNGQVAIDAARGSLAQDLAGARCVVTWNSNSGVDAVLAGVPTIAMDKGSMAWAVAGHALEIPPTPDRSAWAHRLAWCQWSKDELASGACWDAIGREMVDG
jgi:hypothetical protein